MEQGVWQEIELLYQKFQKLGISEAVDYDKYYLYSLITHIRQSGKARNTCYVFEGFMDYLSFLTLRQESCPNYPELDGQDYIVLNSVSNINKALYPLGNYERIHCFFDNDHAGMEALRQIRMEYGRDRYIRDASQIYGGCKDLNEYLQK